MGKNSARLALQFFHHIPTLWTNSHQKFQSRSSQGRKQRPFKWKFTSLLVHIPHSPSDDDGVIVDDRHRGEGQPIGELAERAQTARSLVLLIGIRWHRGRKRTGQGVATEGNSDSARLRGETPTEYSSGGLLEGLLRRLLRRPPRRPRRAPARNSTEFLAGSPTGALAGGAKKAREDVSL